ncbi:MAG: hypothetical protein HYZ91_02475, partial [Candidatus Omnitrophica bacterium]|nr:hypothetical protein [Candidatus Omnitrophota bacterium]
MNPGELAALRSVYAKATDRISRHRMERVLSGGESRGAEYMTYGEKLAELYLLWHNYWHAFQGRWSAVHERLATHAGAQDPESAVGRLLDRLDWTMRAFPTDDYYLGINEAVLDMLEVGQADEPVTDAQVHLALLRLVTARRSDDNVLRRVAREAEEWAQVFERVRTERFPSVITELETAEAARQRVMPAHLSARKGSIQVAFAGERLVLFVTGSAPETAAKSGRRGRSARAAKPVVHLSPQCPDLLAQGDQVRVFINRTTLHLGEALGGGYALCRICPHGMPDYGLAGLSQAPWKVWSDIERKYRAKGINLSEALQSWKQGQTANPALLAITVDEEAGSEFDRQHEATVYQEIENGGSSPAPVQGARVAAMPAEVATAPAPPPAPRPAVQSPEEQEAAHLGISAQERDAAIAWLKRAGADPNSRDAQTVRRQLMGMEGGSIPPWKVDAILTYVHTQGLDSLQPLYTYTRELGRALLLTPPTVAAIAKRLHRLDALSAGPAPAAPQPADTAPKVQAADSTRERLALELLNHAARDQESEAADRVRQRLQHIGLGRRVVDQMLTYIAQEEGISELGELQQVPQVRLSDERIGQIREALASSAAQPAAASRKDALGAKRIEIIIGVAVLALAAAALAPAAWALGWLQPVLAVATAQPEPTMWLAGGGVGSLLTLILSPLLAPADRSGAGRAPAKTGRGRGRPKAEEQSEAGRLEDAAIAARLAAIVRDRRINNLPPHEAGKLRSLHAAIQVRGMLSIPQIRLAKDLIALFDAEAAKPRYASPAVQADVITRMRAINTDYLGRYEQAVVASLLQQAGAPLTIKQVKFGASLAQAAKQREAFADALDVFERSFAPTAPPAEFKQRLPRFLDLLDVLSQDQAAHWVGSVTWGEVLRVVRQLEGAQAAAVHQALLGFMQHRSILRPAPGVVLKDLRTAHHNGLTEGALIRLVHEAARTDRDGALAVLRHAALGTHGLRLSHYLGWEAAVKMMQEFRDEPSIQALLRTLNRRPITVQAIVGEDFLERKIRSRIQAVLRELKREREPVELEPAALSQPKKLAQAVETGLPEELSEEQIQAIRSRVVAGIREAWAQGRVPSEQWAKASANTLHTAATHPSVFGTWLIAMEAAGIPAPFRHKAFAGERGHELYSKDKTDAEIRRLSPEDLELDAMVREFPHLLASALAHYEGWPQAMWANRRVTVHMPPLPPADQASMDQVMLRTDLKRRGAQKRREAQALLAQAGSAGDVAHAVQWYRRAQRAAADAVSAYARVSEMAPEGAEAGATTGRFATQLLESEALYDTAHEGLQGAIRRAVTDALRRLTPQALHALGAGDARRVQQAVQGIIRQHSALEAYRAQVRSLVPVVAATLGGEEPPPAAKPSQPSKILGHGGFATIERTVGALAGVGLGIAGVVLMVAGGTAGLVIGGGLVDLGLLVAAVGDRLVARVRGREAPVVPGPGPGEVPATVRNVLAKLVLPSAVISVGVGTIASVVLTSLAVAAGQVSQNAPVPLFFAITFGSFSGIAATAIIGVGGVWLMLHELGHYAAARLAGVPGVRLDLKHQTPALGPFGWVPTVNFEWDITRPEHLTPAQRRALIRTTEAGLLVDLVLGAGYASLALLLFGSSPWIVAVGLLFSILPFLINAIPRGAGRRRSNDGRLLLSLLQAQGIQLSGERIRTRVRVWLEGGARFAQPWRWLHALFAQEQGSVTISGAAPAAAPQGQIYQTQELAERLLREPGHAVTVQSADGALIAFRYLEGQSGAFSLEARQQERVIGYLDVEPDTFGAPSADFATVHRNMDDQEAAWYVPQDEHGRGIGAGLMKLALAIAWSRGAERFNAYSVYHEKAVAQYRSLGFTPFDTSEDEDYRITRAEAQRQPGLDTISLGPRRIPLPVTADELAGLRTEAERLGKRLTALTVQLIRAQTLQPAADRTALQQEKDDVSRRLAEVQAAIRRAEQGRQGGARTLEGGEKRVEVMLAVVLLGGVAALLAPVVWPIVAPWLGVTGGVVLAGLTGLGAAYGVWRLSGRRASADGTGPTQTARTAPPTDPGRLTRLPSHSSSVREPSGITITAPTPAPTIMTPSSTFSQPGNPMMTSPVAEAPISKRNRLASVLAMSRLRAFVQNVFTSLSLRAPTEDVKDTAATPPTAPTPTATADQRPVILIVDDEQKWREGVQGHLYERFGETYEYVLAENGYRALEVLDDLITRQHKRVTLLVTDLGMPLTGGQLVQAVREHYTQDEWPSTVIMMSDDPRVSDIARARRAETGLNIIGGWIKYLYADEEGDYELGDKEENWEGFSRVLNSALPAIPPPAAKPSQPSKILGHGGFATIERTVTGLLGVGLMLTGLALLPVLGPLRSWGVVAAGIMIGLFGDRLLKPAGTARGQAPPVVVGMAVVSVGLFYAFTGHAIPGAVAAGLGTIIVVAGHRLGERGIKLLVVLAGAWMIADRLWEMSQLVELLREVARPWRPTLVMPIALGVGLVWPLLTRRRYAVEALMALARQPASFLQSRVHADDRYRYLLDLIAPGRKRELSDPAQWEKLDEPDFRRYLESELASNARGEPPARLLQQYRPRLIAFARHVLSREEFKGKKLVFLGRGADLLYDAAEALVHFDPAYADRAADLYLMDWSPEAFAGVSAAQQAQYLAEQIKLETAPRRGVVVIGELDDPSSASGDHPMLVRDLLVHKLPEPLRPAAGQVQTLLLSSLLDPQNPPQSEVYSADERDFDAATWLADVYQSRRRYTVESVDEGRVEVHYTYDENYGPRRLLHKLLLADAAKPRWMRWDASSSAPSGMAGAMHRGMLYTFLDRRVQKMTGWFGRDRMLRGLTRSRTAADEANIRLALEALQPVLGWEPARLDELAQRVFLLRAGNIPPELRNAAGKVQDELRGGLLEHRGRLHVVMAREQFDPLSRALRAGDAQQLPDAERRTLAALLHEAFEIELRETMEVSERKADDAALKVFDAFLEGGESLAAVKVQAFRASFAAQPAPASPALVTAAGLAGAMARRLPEADLAVLHDPDPWGNMPEAVYQSVLADPQTRKTITDHLWDRGLYTTDLEEAERIAAQPDAAQEASLEAMHVIRAAFEARYLELLRGQRVDALKAHLYVNALADLVWPATTPRGLAGAMHRGEEPPAATGPPPPYDFETFRGLVREFMANADVPLMELDQLSLDTSTAPDPGTLRALRGVVQSLDDLIREIRLEAERSSTPEAGLFADTLDDYIRKRLMALKLIAGMAFADSERWDEETRGTVVSSLALVYARLGALRRMSAFRFDSHGLVALDDIAQQQPEANYRPAASLQIPPGGQQLPVSGWTVRQAIERLNPPALQDATGAIRWEDLAVYVDGLLVPHPEEMMLADGSHLTAVLHPAAPSRASAVQPWETDHVEHLRMQARESAKLRRRLIGVEDWATRSRDARKPFTVPQVARQFKFPLKFQAEIVAIFDRLEQEGRLIRAADQAGEAAWQQPPTRVKRSGLAKSVALPAGYALLTALLNWLGITDPAVHDLIVDAGLALAVVVGTVLVGRRVTARRWQTPSTGRGTPGLSRRGFVIGFGAVAVGLAAAGRMVLPRAMSRADRALPPAPPLTPPVRSTLEQRFQAERAAVERAQAQPAPFTLEALTRASRALGLTKTWTQRHVAMFERAAADTGVSPHRIAAFILEEMEEEREHPAWTWFKDQFGPIREWLGGSDITVGDAQVRVKYRNRWGEYHYDLALLNRMADLAADASFRRLLTAEERRRLTDFARDYQWLVGGIRAATAEEAQAILQGHLANGMMPYQIREIASMDAVNIVLAGHIIREKYKQVSRLNLTKPDSQEERDYAAANAGLIPHTDALAAMLRGEEGGSWAVPEFHLVPSAADAASLKSDNAKGRLQAYREVYGWRYYPAWAFDVFAALRYLAVDSSGEGYKRALRKVAIYDALLRGEAPGSVGRRTALRDLLNPVTAPLAAMTHPGGPAGDASRPIALTLTAEERTQLASSLPQLAEGDLDLIQAMTARALELLAAQGLAPASLDRLRIIERIRLAWEACVGVIRANPETGQVLLIGQLAHRLSGGEPHDDARLLQLTVRAMEADERTRGARPSEAVGSAPAGQSARPQPAASEVLTQESVKLLVGQISGLQATLRHLHGVVVDRRQAARWLTEERRAALKRDQEQLERAERELSRVTRPGRELTAALQQEEEAARAWVAPRGAAQRPPEVPSTKLV